MTSRTWNNRNPDFDAALRDCDFGSLVRKARETAGIGQEQLGWRLDCLQSVIARLEKPGNIPKVRTLAALAVELPATLTISLTVEGAIHSAAFDGAPYKTRRERHLEAAILRRRIERLLAD